MDIYAFIILPLRKNLRRKTMVEKTSLHLFSKIGRQGIYFNHMVFWVPLIWSSSIGFHHTDFIFYQMNCLLSRMKGDYTKYSNYFHVMFFLLFLFSISLTTETRGKKKVSWYNNIYFPACKRYQTRVECTTSKGVHSDLLRLELDHSVPLFIKGDKKTLKVIFLQVELF